MLDEDLHATRLLAELERAMKNADLVVRGLAAQPGKRPMAVVSHRQAPKKSDEGCYGFDLALIVKGSVRDQLALEIAKFVQVKQLPTPGTGQLFGDDWSINLVQLEKILAVSSSAGYWLLDGGGSVLAVPAKLISAIAVGRNARDLHWRCPATRRARWRSRGRNSTSVFWWGSGSGIAIRRTCESRAGRMISSGRDSLLRSRFAGIRSNSSSARPFFAGDVFFGDARLHALGRYRGRFNRTMHAVPMQTL